MDTLVIMHSGGMSGPAQDLRVQLRALSPYGPVDLLTPAAGPASELHDGVRSVTTLPYQPLVFPRAARDGLAMVRDMARDVRLFRRELRRRKPGLVLIATAVVPSALIATRLERIPTIVYVAEIFDKGFVRSRPRQLAGAAVIRLVESLATAIVCCSRTVEQQFRGREGSGSVRTIYPRVGSTEPAGDRDGFLRQRGLEPASPCLAVVGNLTAGRGQDILIRALPRIRRELPRVRCLVAGVPHTRAIDRGYAEDLRSLAGRLGVADAVSFLGHVHPIAELYAAADIVINPARFAEPFGRVAVEALAAGRPFIGARVGAIPEIVRDGRDALLVEPDDPDGLAEAVLRLWRDPALRERLVTSGQKWARANFGEEAGVQAYREVIAAVLAGAHGLRARSIS